MWYLCKQEHYNSWPVIRAVHGAYLECSRIWYADRNVCEHRKGLVRPYAFECEVVRNLMDGQEEVVVRGAANRVRGEEEERGQGMCVPQPICEADLQGDNA